MCWERDGCETQCMSFVALCLLCFALFFCFVLLKEKNSYTRLCDEKSSQTRKNMAPSCNVSCERVLARLLRRILFVVCFVCFSQHCLSHDEPFVSSCCFHPRRIENATGKKSQRNGVLCCLKERETVFVEGVRLFGLVSDANVFLLLCQSLQNVFCAQLNGQLGIFVLLLSCWRSSNHCWMLGFWAFRQEIPSRKAIKRKRSNNNKKEPTFENSDF
jgi:hypothetical protein